MNYMIGKKKTILVRLLPVQLLLNFDIILQMKISQQLNIGQTQLNIYGTKTIKSHTLLFSNPRYLLKVVE